MLSARTAIVAFVTISAESGGLETIASDPRRVFVVHGRNDAVRDSMFAFLRALDLAPIEWDQAIAMTGKGSPYIGEILDVAFDRGQAVVVLMTPDDIVQLRPEYAAGLSDPELSPQGQARPNVLFEAGMAMGRNSDRTILVELGSIRPFSDVGGRHAIRLDNSGPKRQSLASRLATAGCPVDRTGGDWLTAGDFSLPEMAPPVAVGRRIPSTSNRGPRVDAHWYDRGSSRFDELKVTNNGSEPLFGVRVEVPEGLAAVRVMQEDPVKRLPVGKTFTVRADAGNKTMGGPQAPDQFDLIVTAELEDGTEFKQEVFIDVNG